MKPLRENCDTADFLSLAATRLSFTGAKVRERRLIPDAGYTFETGPDKNVVFLKNRGGGTTGTITCECGLEGGSCVIVVANPGEIDEYAYCSPDSGCGSSGLFCFMEVVFTAGVKLRFKM